jgi:hypothetical protein
MKLTYTPPTLTDLGTVRELTLGQSTGGELDATFPAGTPFADLTFSN